MESWQVPPAPELWAWLIPIYNAWCGLGRDPNGTVLYGESTLWLDRNLPEPGEHEAGEVLFSVLNGCAAAIHEELYPPPKEGK